MSLFKIINDALPLLKREQFLAQHERGDKLCWIADAFSRCYGFPPETAFLIVKGTVIDCVPAQFATLEALDLLVAKAAASISLQPPPLYGWQTIH